MGGPLAATSLCDFKMLAWAGHGHSSLILSDGCTLAVMEKNMEPSTVKTHQGKIFLEQPDNGEGRACIAIDPSQVPMLIGWLEEAAKELLKTAP
jgi:hypothetical protein